jgi:hypothetical protein
MSTAKRLAWIAAGYAVSVSVGIAAVAINELRMSEDVLQGSPGMVAFGDVVLFVFVSGFFGLVPTCFLLKLFIEKALRTLLTIELLVAAMGPPSWLAATSLVGSSGTNLPQGIAEELGPFIAFVAIPRMVFGPVFLVIEGLTFLLVRGRVTRTVLAVAMLMDLVPLGLFALHMARMPRY